ncbi:MAG: outer membrane protein assembly factor BamB [Gammaproteobacteria bacterium]|nr:outer membrane protein assembly factor BamB [Gammaproteobacteria bacterium]
MKRLLALALVTLLTTGCGSMSALNPASWFGGGDTVEPPAELVDLSNLIRVRTLWSKNIGSGSDNQRVKLAPTLSDNRIYVAEHDGGVQAIEMFDGKSVWSVDVDMEISGGAGSGDGLVLVGSSDAELLALSQETGEELWRARVSSEVLSVPVAENGVAVVQTIDGKLFGFDTVTGEQIWIFDRTVPVLSLHGSSSPVISGSIVIAGFASGKLAAVDLLSGDVLWEVGVTAPSGRSELERMVDIDGDPLLVEGAVFVGTYQGELAGVTENAGIVMWRRKLSSYSGLGGDWRQLYVSDAEDSLWAMDPDNGSAIWKNDTLRGRKLSTPALVGDYVVVGDYEGYLHWFDSNDGEMLARVQAGSDAITARPLVEDGVLYVYGEGGRLTALTVEEPEDF